MYCKYEIQVLERKTYCEAVNTVGMDVSKFISKMYCFGACVSFY